MSEVIDSGIERLRAVVAEHGTGSEQADALSGELRGQIAAIKGKGAPALRRAYGDQLDGILTPQGALAETVRALDPDHVLDDVSTRMITEGGRLAAEAITTQSSALQLAKRLAALQQELRLRVLWYGYPDLLGASGESRLHARVIYRLAGDALRDQGMAASDMADALRRIKRSTQNQIRPLRVAYLRSLDEDEEARRPYAALLEGTSRPASEVVAEHYKVPLETRRAVTPATPGELELVAALGAYPEAERATLIESDDEARRAAQQLPVEDRLAKSIRTLRRAILVAPDVDDLRGVSRETLDQMREQVGALEEAVYRLKRAL